MNRRRVVITGLGGIASLGCTAGDLWEALLAGRSGISTVSGFDATGIACRIAGEATAFDPLAYFPKNEARKMDRYTQIALVAAGEAIADSGLDLEREDPERVGCIMGTGIGGIQELEHQKEVLDKRGPSRVSPFLIPKMMPNAMSGMVSIRYGIKGPNFVTSSACASSAHAIGAALRTIRFGEADVMVTGGAEAAITPLAMAGFSSLKALSTRNDEPERASRPFDKDRDGFVLGEGGAGIILEEYEHAQRRGASIYAEVRGFGATADAYHITAPKEDGEGPARAMMLALREGGVDPSTVDYINAHGTSTVYNDLIETTAIKKVFGPHAYNLAVSSSKSMIGHLLGGAGAVECLVTTLSVRHQAAHPTINLENPDPACDLDYIPGEAREMRIRNALSNSLGFGGHNACILLSAL